MRGGGAPVRRLPLSSLCQHQSWANLPVRGSERLGADLTSFIQPLFPPSPGVNPPWQGGTWAFAFDCLVSLPAGPTSLGSGRAGVPLIPLEDLLDLQCSSLCKESCDQEPPAAFSEQPVNAVELCRGVAVRDSKLCSLGEPATHLAPFLLQRLAASRSRCCVGFLLLLVCC